jgi:hypothetical protein
MQASPVNLMVFPVILGTGKKAFEEKSERRNLRLKEAKVVGDGVLVLIYERAARASRRRGEPRLLPGHRRPEARGSSPP